MALTSLPLELLQQIVGIVGTEHPPSLYTFTLINSFCREAALPLLFRHIQITVSDPGKLQDDVASLLRTLSRTGSAQHIRRISIKGDARSKALKTSEDSPDIDDSEPPDGLQEILGSNTTLGMRNFVVYDEPVIIKSSAEDMVWTPVVDLLQASLCLQDLIYDCQSQFPPSLLEVLHQQHPKCRLHHLTFRFRTLLWGTPYPYEMEIATSPSLYRLNVVCAWRDSDGDDDFNLEAAMDLASGLAPNLKEVSISEIWPIGCWRYDRRRRETWPGLPGLTGKVGGSLTSWTWIGCDGAVGPNFKKSWRRITDLTHLKHLTVGRFYNEVLGISGEQMKWIIQNRAFPHLETLSVALYRNDSSVDKPDYVENAISFFQSFRPLEEVSVYGPVDVRILDTILLTHGALLRKLIIHPREYNFSEINNRSVNHPPMVFTRDHLSQIAILCPLLEELSVVVKRNESCASEVELYKCFGKMASLRNLFLILDCSSQTLYEATEQHVPDPPDSDEDQKFLRWYGCTKDKARKILINCAVDESLARSIWRTIDRNKEGRRFERLRLWPMGNKYYHGQTYLFEIIVAEMSRSWLVERSPRDDQVDPIARELGKLSREYDQATRHWPKKFQGELEQLFRSIWPCKKGSKDWRDDWSSFPLEGWEIPLVDS